MDNLDSEIADVMLDDDDVDKAINNTLKKIEMATLNDTTAGDLNRTMRILERVIGLTNFSSGIINDQVKSPAHGVCYLQKIIIVEKKNSEKIVLFYKLTTYS